MSDKFVDPVVAEVHANRAAMLDAAAGNVETMMQQVADRQQLSSRQIIREPLRNLFVCCADVRNRSIIAVRETE